MIVSSVVAAAENEQVKKNKIKKNKELVFDVGRDFGRRPELRGRAAVVFPDCYSFFFVFLVCVFSFPFRVVFFDCSSYFALSTSPSLPFLEQTMVSLVI